MGLGDTGRLRDSYECVIVGAGPAGLAAAARLLSRAPGPTVLLLDKSEPWLRTKPCAEAVGRLGLEQCLTVDRRWIRHDISSVAFHGPGGGQVTYTDAHKGFIVDRALMQRSMAERCVEAGMDCRTGCAVAGVSAPADGRRTVTLAGGGSVSAGVVIDAAGASSPIGKSEGLIWKASDAEPAYYVIAENVAHATDTVHLHVGAGFAPGGYGWCFPSADDRANIGVLIGRSRRGRVNIRDLLKGFLQSRFPSAQVLSYHAGTIPCGYRRGELARPGLVKAGDSASTVNPISRAGIVEAMKCGEIAAGTALAMLGADTERRMARICREYEASWYRLLGRRHQKLQAVKSAMQDVPDRDYDSAAEELTRIPQAEITLGRIFRVALGRSPRLLWAMRHML